MTQQQATIRNMGAIREHHAVSIPATPFTDGRPDPRPETAPPRGIISRKPRSRAEITIAAIREVYNEWRSEA